MYKKDYHPDAGLIFKTKNYGFDSPKSVPLEPLSNALIQIDAALKKEETERIAEDVRINARVDKEIADRESADTIIHAKLDNITAGRKSGIRIVGENGGCSDTLVEWMAIGKYIDLQIIGAMWGSFYLGLSSIFDKDIVFSDVYGSNVIMSLSAKRENQIEYPQVVAHKLESSFLIISGTGNTTDESKKIQNIFHFIFEVN